jgi:ABC-type transport system involved in cytochrome c biogenesis ATPase subunit
LSGFAADDSAKVWILDEPFLAMDAANTQLLCQKIRNATQPVLLLTPDS